MKISNHARLRMRERSTFYKDGNAVFRNALHKGKSSQEIKDENVRNFINSKVGKCKVKLYNDYVFVYSKNTKILRTMYKLPDELLGREKYRK